MGKLRNARRKPSATLDDLKDSQWSGGVIEHRGDEYKVVVRGGRERAWIVESVQGVRYRANVWQGVIDLELIL